MTENAASLSSVVHRTGEVAQVGSASRWRHPPAMLWPVFIAVQVGSALWLTSYTYFFVDDFLFLQQARTQAFGWAYLREPLFEHFSPVTRALNALLIHVAPGDFAVAHGIQLAIYAATLAAFALVARTILGNSWTAFALTGISGQSLFLFHLLTWWTATANILPASCFALIALAGYLRWRKSGSRSWLLASVVAFALTLLDYETAMLFPVYLALVRLLVLEDRLNPRAWLVALWRERWAWLSYGVLDALAAFHYVRDYYQPAVRPPAGELAHYLEIALVETFVPALVGIKNPMVPLTPYPLALVAAWLVIMAAVAVTLYLRPRAWRCIPAFLLIFLATMTPVGLNRIHQFGLGVAVQLDYYQSVHYMFIALTALALSPQWGGRRASPGAPGHFLTIRRPSTGALTAAGLAIIAVYTTLYVTSAGAMAGTHWQARGSRSYVTNFITSLERVRTGTHREPVLIDLQVPEGIMPAVFAPFNRYSQFFPVVDHNLRINQIADPAFIVNDSGQLVPVRFTASAYGRLSAATVSSPDGSDVVPASQVGSSTACVPERHPVSRLHVPLSTAQTVTARPSGLPYGIRISYVAPLRATVPVVLGSANGVAVDTGVNDVWGPGEGGELAPVTLQQEIDEIAFDLTAGSCVTDLTFGVFDISGPPA